jgi:hypothetical protein
MIAVVGIVVGIVGAIFAASEGNWDAMVWALISSVWAANYWVEAK